MYLIEQILKDSILLKQSLLYLYACQTMEEQVAEVTVESNGQGFNKLDADILSSFAQQILKGYELSDRQYNVLRLRIPKYHGQLQDGAWQQIDIPAIQVSRSNDSVTKKSAGTLKTEITPGGAIGLVFYPNVFPSKQIKSIGFTRWENSCWHQSGPSVNVAAVADILKMFGENVIVDPSVTDAIASPDIELPSWLTDHDSLFDFQIDAIRFMLERKRVMLALAPGLGKTVCAIYAAQVAGCQRVLVVSPLSLLYTWRGEIRKWTGEETAIVYKKQLLVPARYTLTNYDTLRLHPAMFIEGEWDVIVIDESLLIKNRKAKRTAVVKRLVQETKSPYVWLLSGAPVSKFYTDMWAQMNVLDQNRFTSFWRFAERYVQIDSNQWSKYNIVANLPDAAECIKADLADIYFARSQEDSGLNIPDWIFDDIHVPLSAEQDKLYGSMEESFLAELAEDDILMATNVLTQLLRLVQFASNAVLVGGIEKSTKWDACEELLEFETGPFIIWTNFIETANRMLDRLQLRGYRAAKLTGATPMQERQHIVDDFQDGKLDVIVAHPAVGKFGLTLTAARTAIYLERGYNGDDYFQSLHRVKRIGTKYSPHIIHLIADRLDGSKTVDNVIAKILEGRKDMVDKITHMHLKELFQEME